MLVVANVLQPLIDFADAILQFFHEEVGVSWGVAIICLTVVIRLLILPLTFRSVKSMQELQQLQPEIKRIQERYKDDRQRMNQEVMRFYQEHKVNPLSSCFPILLQIPFFISLFYLLRDDKFQEDIRGEESFLFIDDLADKVTDPLVLGVLIVLYIATQLGATLVTAISADKNQRRIMLALPFVFVIFIFNFEAGLIVYWITTNVWTIGQQLLVRKIYPKHPVGEEGKAEGDGKVPARGKPPAAKGPPAPKPAAARAVAGAGNGRSSKPPASPRKKKKRSGRRR